MVAEEEFESMSFAVTAELVGASRKNYASCLKYATNCDFFPAPKKKKNLKALNFQGFLCDNANFDRIEYPRLSHSATNRGIHFRFWIVAPQLWGMHFLSQVYA